jgi:ribosome-associated translation inhibitor RaiA
MPPTSPKDHPMQFQFNSDNNVAGQTELADGVEELVRARLARVSDRLTRVEVHVGDVNGPRDSGDDKRCAIEIRPAGMQPLTATDQAATIHAAVASAADKVLSAFDRQVGKQTTRKGH